VVSAGVADRRVDVVDRHAVRIGADDVLPIARADVDARLPRPHLMADVDVGPSDPSPCRSDSRESLAGIRTPGPVGRPVRTAPRAWRPGREPRRTCGRWLPMSTSGLGGHRPAPIRDAARSRRRPTPSDARHTT
jgi:hypothetical protein